MSSLSRLDASSAVSGRFGRETVASTDGRVDLSSRKLLRLPSQVCLASGLVSLDLSNNVISDLPEELVRLTTLRRLLAAENDLEANAFWIIGQLPGLTELDLSYNDMSVDDFPWRVHYRQLTSLNLSSNRLEAIPPAVYSLRYLETLDVSDNNITRVSDDIKALQLLSSLNLSKNRLQAVSSEVGSLRRLRWLDMSINRLYALPLELAQLPLEYLACRYNLIRSFPQFRTEVNIRVLDLHSNGIRAIPAAISAFCLLEQLTVSCNFITSIDKAIAECASLTWLDCSVNRLRLLPPEMADLEHLRDIRLGQNPLDSSYPLEWPSLRTHLARERAASVVAAAAAALAPPLPPPFIEIHEPPASSATSSASAPSEEDEQRSSLRFATEDVDALLLRRSPSIGSASADSSATGREMQPQLLSPGSSPRSSAPALLSTVSSVSTTASAWSLSTASDESLPAAGAGHWGFRDSALPPAASGAQSRVVPSAANAIQLSRSYASNAEEQHDPPRSGFPNPMRRRNTVSSAAVQHRRMSLSNEPPSPPSQPAHNVRRHSLLHINVSPPHAGVPEPVFLPAIIVTPRKPENVLTPGRTKLALSAPGRLPGSPRSPSSPRALVSVPSPDDRPNEEADLPGLAGGGFVHISPRGRSPLDGSSSRGSSAALDGSPRVTLSPLSAVIGASSRPFS